MAGRKAWKDLSPAYRRRLEFRGVTSRTHAVADLTEARGHPSTPPAGAVPKATIERLLKGEGLPQEFTELLDQFTWPTWVPRRVSTTRYGGAEPVFVEVAAALSRLPHPRWWTEVKFDPVGDGEPWTMTVYLKGNRHPKTILIPGGGQEFSGARQVLGIVTELREESEAAQRRRQAEALFFEVRESP